MLITDLDYMENLVARRKNLLWDGYNVIRLIRHRNPVVFKDARFINGQWFRTQTVELTSVGWVLPDDFFGKA